MPYMSQLDLESVMGWHHCDNGMRAHRKWLGHMERGGAHPGGARKAVGHGLGAGVHCRGCSTCWNMSEHIEGGHEMSRRGEVCLWWSACVYGAMQDMLGIWVHWKGGQTCSEAGHMSGWGLSCGASLRCVIGGLV